MALIPMEEEEIKIYDGRISGITVSSDNGYSNPIPYSSISSEIDWNKIIGCFLTGWSANALLAPQAYQDALYIYSTKAFSSQNIYVRIVCKK